jgi:LuxR family maltose regulon positive regulatory protein
MVMVVPNPVAGVVERPRLFALLDRGALGRVTLLSAPAGSGKTMLLASWLSRPELPGAVAWVGVDRDERDATRFWLAVVEALRGTGAIAAEDPLATLLPAPLADQDEFLTRLLDGLGHLEQTVLLVVDDLHQLRSEDALRGLGQLLERAPAQLRTVLVSRRDPKLGLHRLRLAGELTEIRAAELGFTEDEAAELMVSAGVAVADGDLARLHARTEGWAAGLRLAALSLARHDAPDRFVAEFSGSERTVADYLLGEVLASQPPEVRDLLLRTCILDRVNGRLADLLTGRADGDRLLHELEEANALVVAVDVARSWFRYHHLLADLLRLELRREAPGEIPRLHRLAAGWHADHGDGIAAIRHAALAQDWELATELLGRHWVHLLLEGEEATLGSLLADLPDGLVERDAELATIAAADRLAESRWGEADTLIAAAETAFPAIPDDRRRRTETALATIQLLRARRLGGLEDVLDAAKTALDSAGGPAGTELKAFALMNLGMAESWTLRLDDAEPHLEEGLALARRAGAPYVEIGCLGALGITAYLSGGGLDVAEERFKAAIEDAERLGWSTNAIVGPSYATLATLAIDRGRLADAQRWLEHADPILTHSPEPAAGVGLRHAQGMLAYARGQFAEALERFREGGRLAGQLRAPYFLAAVEEQWCLRTQIRLGDSGPARAALEKAGDLVIGVGAWCNLAAWVGLADDDPERAAAAVAPVLDGTAFVVHVNQRIEAALLDAVARARLGDWPAAERSVESALDLAEPGGRVWIVLAVPGVEDVLAAHPVHRTAHAAHLKTLLDHLGGGASAEAPGELAEPLSERELAVLRFLPTNLSAADIGSELFLSVHTVKTHMRKLYAKLDVHTRAEAVQRGRALGLLGPGG